MVSHGDVAGPTALVGAVEGAGAFCCDGKVNGVDSYDGEIYVQGGLGSDSEGEDYLSVIYCEKNPPHGLRDICTGSVGGLFKFP